MSKHLKWYCKKKKIKVSKHDIMIHQGMQIRNTTLYYTDPTAWKHLLKLG